MGHQERPDDRGERVESSSDSSRVRSDDGGDSIVDLARRPVVKAWTRYLTVLFALVAVGFGIFGIFGDAIDESILEEQTGPAGIDAAFEAALSVPLTVTPYLAIFAAVFVGAFLERQRRGEPSTAYVAAGLGMGVATFVFWVLAVLFGSVSIDGASLDIGGLFVNAILAGVAASVVATGGVWATRTQAPLAFVDAEDRRGDVQ